MTNDLTLALDPGPLMSGWITWKDEKIELFGHESNDLILQRMENYGGADTLVIEDVSHYGKDVTVGKDVFETCKWSGRFDQANRALWGGAATYITRPDIKLHLLGVRRGTDGQVRQALIDKYGGNEVAIGGKKCRTCKGKGWNGVGRPGCLECHHQEVNNREDGRDMGCGYETHPGPLHGISGHVWSALAVLVTYLDTTEKN